MIGETVCRKIGFAKARLKDIEKLIESNQLSSDFDARHQLTQEFFFHLLGSIEYLAQLVNESRALRIDINKVVVHLVIKKLEGLDPPDAILPILKCLSANTKLNPCPTDPYSDDGLIYRIINYRNEVVHRNINPFHFTMSAGPKAAFFWLDPRNLDLGKSVNTIDVDLMSMFTLVDEKCRNALAILEN